MAEIDTWKGDLMALLVHVDVKLPSVPDDIVTALPDITRQAGKRIANQPDLWCKGEYHLLRDEQPRDWRTGRFIPRAQGPQRQACALGHVADILIEQFGHRGQAATGTAWSLLNRASEKAIGWTIPVVNDDPATTPEVIGDHLFVVADELEFGDA